MSCPGFSAEQCITLSPRALEIGSVGSQAALLLCIHTYTTHMAGGSLHATFESTANPNGLSIHHPHHHPTLIQFTARLPDRHYLGTLPST
ncbi:hypothetical protein LB505_009084 [Fusarium chuoi]|nr:hypothetical protein LB505_009084 [Fusarium chuoi]